MTYNDELKAKVLAVKAKYEEKQPETFSQQVERVKQKYRQKTNPSEMIAKLKKNIDQGYNFNPPPQPLPPDQMMKGDVINLADRKQAMQNKPKSLKDLIQSGVVSIEPHPGEVAQLSPEQEEFIRKRFADARKEQGIPHEGYETVNEMGMSPTDKKIKGALDKQNKPKALLQVAKLQKAKQEQYMSARGKRIVREERRIKSAEQKDPIANPRPELPGAKMKKARPKSANSIAKEFLQRLRRRKYRVD